MRSPLSTPDIRAFADGLDSGFEFIDRRDAQIGMGFSWGRDGPKTEVTRFKSQPIFAYNFCLQKTGEFA